MNRVIKFRAWDGENMQTEFIFDNEDLLIRKFEVEHGIWSAREKWKLMQFTGLTDKNGREIYEGDILLRPRADGTGTYKPVRWSEHPCAFMWGREYLYSSSTPERMEVIGNIYENSYLLSEPKEKV